MWVSCPNSSKLPFPPPGARPFPDSLSTFSSTTAARHRVNWSPEERGERPFLSLCLLSLAYGTWQSDAKILTTGLMALHAFFCYCFGF